MLFRYFLNDFQVVPVAPVITGITSVITLHIRCISIVRCWRFTVFSASFLITLPLPETAMSINAHVTVSLLRIMTSGLLLSDACASLHLFIS
jgi:hypothetical protein